MKNLCDQCPDEVRGLCCCMNIPIGNYNIVLEHVKCPYLNSRTMKCNIYNEKRREKIAWCDRGEAMFHTGGLPKGCLYLKEDPSREEHPKRKIKEILKEISQKHLQLELVGKYNFFNNIPFRKFIEYIEQQKEVTVP